MYVQFTSYVYWVLISILSILSILRPLDWRQNVANLKLSWKKKWNMEIAKTYMAFLRNRLRDMCSWFNALMGNDSLAILLKSHLGMVVLLLICCIFSEHLLRTHLKCCFWMIEYIFYFSFLRSYSEFSKRSKYLESIRINSGVSFVYVSETFKKLL